MVKFHFAGDMSWNSAVSCLADSQCMLYLPSHKSSSYIGHCRYICSTEPCFAFINSNSNSNSNSNVSHSGLPVRDGFLTSRGS